MHFSFPFFSFDFSYLISFSLSCFGCDHLACHAKIALIKPFGVWIFATIKAVSFSFFFFFIFLLWTPRFQYLHLFYVAKLFGLINVQFLVNRHLHDVLFALCRYTLFYSLQIFTMCGWTRQTKCWKISLFYQLAMERIMGTCLSYLYVQLFYFEVDGGLCMELPYIKLKYLWLIKFKWQLLLRRCPFSWKNWSW